MATRKTTKTSSNPAARPVMTLDETLAALEEAAKFKSEFRLAFFKPYPKQSQHLEGGAVKRERLLSGGNQVGKSETGAFEVACHLTGMYPSWWKGKRFKKATKGWACGETSLLVRDVQQKKLCGEPGVDSAFGTGMIPKDLFASKPSMARGITDAYDAIQVRHVSGGISVLKFKSYEQGRAKHQGETLDFIWDDEEPPEDIYGEHTARLTGAGILFITFTPLKGRSNVVRRFMDEESPHRMVTFLPLSDVKHFTEDEKAIRVAGYAAHEREAREKGIPLLGSGAVYQFSAENIKEPQIQNLPPHWAKLWGIDFGIGHPFAAVLAAWDRDNDVIHIVHCLKVPDLLPMMHAAAIKAIAANVPVAWPHDGNQRQQGSDTAEQLASIYRKHGLNMLAEHATWETGGYSREAAVTEITERAMTGRLRVANHLSEWFQEFMLYHRKDGLIVRKEDDIMSATEKIIMAKRFSRAVPLGSKVIKRRTGLIAHGTESEDYWGL